MSTNNKAIVFLKKFMVENDFNQQQLGDKLGISRQYINLILNENKLISPALAVKLGKLTHRNTDFWLGKSQSEEKLGNKDDLLNLWKQNGSRILVDHEIKTAIEYGLIKIKPFKTENLEPSSYVLSIGKKILLSNLEGNVDGAVHLNEDDPDIILNPGDEAAILTEEHLTIPKNITASLSPTTKIFDTKVSLLRGGVVHPGFEGLLCFMIKNSSRRKKGILLGEKIIRIQFTYLPIAPENTYKGEMQNLNDFPEGIKAYFNVDTQAQQQ